MAHIGSQEQLLSVVPNAARLKSDGYVYLDEPRFLPNPGHLGPETPEWLDGSGRSYFVPDGGAAVLLSDATASLGITAYYSSGELNVLTVFPDVHPLTTDLRGYRNDGTFISPPMSVAGLKDDKFLGSKRNVTTSVMEAVIYDSVTGLSTPDISVVSNPARVASLQNNPSLPPFEAQDVTPAVLTAIEDGIYYGLAPQMNLVPTTEHPNNWLLENYGRLTLEGFASLSDGSSLRFSFRYSPNSIFTVDNGFLYAFSEFLILDLDAEIQTPILTEFDIFGCSLEDGFGFGRKRFDEKGIFSLFSLDTGEELVSIALGDKIHDVDYLGDGRFRYLADSGNGLIRGEFGVVPVPAAAWLFFSSLLGLTAVRKMIRNV